MSMTFIADTYVASINEQGEFYDNPFATFTRPMTCPCRGDIHKVYDTKQSFKSHTKTKGHQGWLEKINLNKRNYYEEVIRLRILTTEQKIIIAQLEKSLATKSLTVDRGK